MNVKEMICEELSRLSKGGQFDEAFWQRMYDLDGRTAYMQERESRRIDARLAESAAQLAIRQAVTVEEQRKARKLLKRAKVLNGLLRLYARDSRKDPLVVAYQEQSKWISNARDLGVHILRWHVSASK